MAFPQGSGGSQERPERVIQIEDIPDLVGDVFEGATLTVSTEERDQFERITHITEAYPQPDAPEFPENIVEGFHTLALLDAMTTLVRPFDPETTFGFNYGLDRVRFMSPVKAGDTIRSKFEVLEVKEKGEGWLILHRCELTAEGATKPALVAEWWLYILPRSH